MQKLVLRSLLVFLSLSSCKKDDPALDGTTSGNLSCLAEGGRIASAAYATHGNSSIGLQDVDILTIHASTPKGFDFIVYYMKPSGSAELYYRPTSIRYETGYISYSTPIVYPLVNGTLTRTAKGWSGTFFAQVSKTSTGIDGTVTGGIFTDIEER